MRYLPYNETAGMPNIVVDGFGNDGTVMVLSHWPGAGTPPALADDLSTQIAFRYLDSPDAHVQAEAVTNNHFDEDGLCGIYAIINPDDAQRRRDQIVDVARAGDFATWRNRGSARIAMTLMAYADEDRSPLDPSAFTQPYPAQAAALYEETLRLFPQMLDDVTPFKGLWEDEDAKLQASLDALAKGAITIDERPDIDLAIVRVSGEEAPHDMAIHNATERFRILTLRGARPSLRYRYESWVMYQSRPVMPRVSLGSLAEELSSRDSTTWTAGDVDDLQPSLEPKGETSLAFDDVEAAVVTFLQSSSPQG